MIAYWNSPSVDHYSSIEEALSDFLVGEGQTGEMALRKEIPLLLSDDPQYLEKLNSPGLGGAIGGMSLPRDDVRRMLAALKS